MKMKIKKGDTIQVLAGKDRGKSGTVIRVAPKDETVLVEGINLVKKHVRPRKSMPHGGIVSTPAAMPVGKVMVVCPRCKKATRVAVTIDKEGVRHRTCKKCHEVWPK